MLKDWNGHGKPAVEMTSMNKESIKCQLTGELSEYGGKIERRRAILKALCPCRNGNTLDVDTWRSIVRICTNGSLKERNSAAHAIGTLLAKAEHSKKWRKLAQEIAPDIHDLMDDTRASRSLLGTLKKHGHATKGTARKNYRRSIKSLKEQQTPQQLASWLNKKLLLDHRHRIDATHPGIQRLALWNERRRKFQPNRRTSETEILAQARQLLPTFFSLSTQVTK